MIYIVQRSIVQEILLVLVITVINVTIALLIAQISIYLSKGS